jgi:hypothetical protein
MKEWPSISARHAGWEKMQSHVGKHRAPLKITKVERLA